MIGLHRDRQARELARALRPDRAPDEVLAALSWSVLSEPGDADGGVLRERAGLVESVALALAESAADARSLPALASARKRWRPRADAGLVLRTTAAARHLGAQLVLPGDDDWPASADDLWPHAPVLLWVRGRRELLAGAQRAVALVGARAATPYGENLAREFAGDLALRGHTIVSGGAYGIDGAAHRAALGVGGDTVAIVAGGVDRAYPSGHASLLAEIATRGAVISEVPCGTPPSKWRFLGRNRLIAALSAATVVIEAGWRSGSLNTAGHAAQLGRPLGAVPGPVTSAASAGCHRLLREYDARCVTASAEICELLGDAPATAPAAPPVDHEHTRLADALSMRVFRRPDDIARRSGLAVERVEAMLGLLALEGDVERGDGGWRLVRQA